jgi:hypothetical protein
VQRVFLRFASSWWLYGLVSGLLLAQVLQNAIPGDSNVFFNAGLDVRNGINPWLESEDPINFQFLNGPLFSILCSILTFLGARGMYLFTCLASIAFVPWCALLAGRLFGIPLEGRYLAGVSSFLMLIFPIRANLQYGQFVIPYVLLLLLILHFHCSLKTSSFGDFTIGVGFIILLDFKPHLFLIWIFIFFGPQRKFMKVGLLVGGLAELLILKLITGVFLPHEWFSRLFNRGKGSDGLAGFYNIHTLIVQAKLPSGWDIALSVGIVLFLSRIIFRYMSSKTSTFVLLYLALFPVMHPQDFFLLFLLAILSIGDKQWSKLEFFIAGLSLVWSSNLLVLTINSLAVLCIYFTFANLRKSKKSSLELSLLVLPCLLIRICDCFGISMDSYRITANILAILGVLLIVGSHSKKNGMKQLINQLTAIQKS